MRILSHDGVSISKDDLAWRSLSHMHMPCNPTFVKGLGQAETCLARLNILEITSGALRVSQYNRSG